MEQEVIEKKQVLLPKLEESKLNFQKSLLNFIENIVEEKKILEKRIDVLEDILLPKIKLYETLNTRGGLSCIYDSNK